MEEIFILFLRIILFSLRSFNILFFACAGKFPAISFLSIKYIFGSRPSDLILWFIHNANSHPAAPAPIIDNSMIFSNKSL